jgi:hypothetical protein
LGEESTFERKKREILEEKTAIGKRYWEKRNWEKFRVTHTLSQN